MAKPKDEFTLRVSKHGDFGTTDEARGERRSAVVVHGPGDHGLSADATRLHAKAAAPGTRRHAVLPDVDPDRPDKGG